MIKRLELILIDNTSLLSKLGSKSWEINDIVYFFKELLIAQFVKKKLLSLRFCVHECRLLTLQQ